MEDFFALLDLPRRPWLDPQTVQAKFLQLSADMHPDRVHGAPEAARREATAAFIRLNSAAHCLRETRDRLRHLLELETGRPVSNLDRVPAASAGFYFRLGALLAQADRVAAERAKATSRLAKAQLIEPALELRDRLQEVEGQLAGQRAELEERIKGLDKRWEQPPGTDAQTAARPVEELELLFRESSFLSRWSAQVRARIVELSMPDF